MAANGAQGSVLTLAVCHLIHPLRQLFETNRGGEPCASRCPPSARFPAGVSLWNSTTTASGSRHAIAWRSAPASSSQPSKTSNLRL